MPASTTPGEVTLLLAALRQGDEQARDRLFPLVYAELRRAASRQLLRETPGHTLEPTALVHEAYLKLAGPAAGGARNREHFVAIAARAMRQVLVDHARKRRAAKRGAGVVPVMISSQAAGVGLPVEELVALDDALDRLNALNPRLREVVELRFFGGLGEDEVARHLGVTVRTAQRDWAKARAFLYKELYPA
jgi:RNA polymerase sigma factor (TIGR02999 family)